MTTSEFELFLSDFLIIPSNIPYFWNLIYLATGDFARYDGPKNMDEFLDWVKNRKCYGRADQVHDKKLLDFYSNFKSSDTQICIKWVKILTPLVARYDQLPGILQKTGMTELDCYNTVVLEHKKIQNKKLQYDLLTRVIDKIKPIAENDRIYAEPYKNLYNVARFFRTTCDWAKNSQDSHIRDVLISDKLYNLSNHRTAAGKLKMARSIMNLMMQKLEYTIQTTPPQYQESAIRDVCQQAYRCAAYAGAENQDFVNEMWDVFNWRNIINLPAVVTKQIKR
ncbi:MAG: hypothetical protein MJ164_02815 [Alphaproteobacteria bacterium]|nr:hypothetical protein [Alphaproteobacteria bacterium]